MELGISDEQVETRALWVRRLKESAATFAATSLRTFEELRREVEADGPEKLLSHVRFCGTIPESYRHDSTEEKAYSKYTDSVIAEALTYLGLNATVLDGRADMADVEAVAPTGFSLVADAKAFRLTRTAKNQKDFKVAAMDRWRYGNDFALVVAPIDQLPSRASQIYLDSSARNVCVLSYSHLAAVIQAKEALGGEVSMSLLKSLLAEPGLMNPSKDSRVYWRAMNQVVVSAGSEMRELWRAEKVANLSVVDILKREGLAYYARERAAILGLSHQEALDRLMRTHKIDEKIEAILGYAGNDLLDVV